MIDPFHTTVEEEIRKAKKVLYLVVNIGLLGYGTIVVAQGAVELFHDQGRGLLLTALGLVGIRLWLRWTEPWIRSDGEADG